MGVIQWNKVTWYSKLFALVLFVALPFIGFYYGVQYGKLVGAANRQLLSSAANTSIETLPAYYATPSEWQTDANNTNGGFSIAYPIDFDTQDNYSATPSTDWRVNAGNVSGVRYFTLTVPRAFEPQTNFGDATLTVGASSNNNAMAQCMTADATAGPAVATSSVVIDTVPFTVFYSSDAGAGNIYETVSYRTIHAGKCYAVEYTVHSGQLANYPESYGLTQFDETRVAALMHNIVGTFKFR
ncbi:MAG: hypothetical protein P4L81_08565 [Candidatus Pacebacteria bacterium]|nr:hypothetical protein [Candidatus Paceibacterota bacterium]